MKLTQLLNELLVLVQLLEGISVHEGDFVGLGLVAMLLVAEHAHPHLGAGDVLQPEGDGQQR